MPAFSPPDDTHPPAMSPPPTDTARGNMSDSARRARMRIWACSRYTMGATVLGFTLVLLMARSFLTRQLDSKGCDMSYMRPSFFKFDSFDTEHTRFASKYSLYLYREGGIDEDFRVKGVPVLFIPGNAGSYKQARSLASEAAYYYYNGYYHNPAADKAGKRPLDFFSVDFNEDFTAFHGQTLLDQAEYLNDAIAFILSLYHDPSHSLRDPELPDPTSVIIVGHSMGGMVARTMLTMPNYQSRSINSIITMSAPHAVPPVSFDGEIVRIYKGVNDYWRHAYSQKWAVDNPLWHVTLVSIAGGGLDTIVSSDYASLASLVPETHGFTVFTASIPGCWTGTDHLSITWCDQVRKSIIRALYDVIDVGRPSQTLPRAERLRGFKKWFLTGLEDAVDKSLHHKELKTLLTLGEGGVILSQGEKLILRKMGQGKQKPKAYLLPVPPHNPAESRNFHLLTNEHLDSEDENGNLEVLFCSIFPLQAGQSETLFEINMDLSGDSSGATRLACGNGAADVITLPASTRHSTFPFKKEEPPFSFLQYSMDELLDHQFIAVVDKADGHNNGWVLAGFTEASESALRAETGLGHFLATGLTLKLPADRPVITDIQVPSLGSSLLAHSFEVGKRSCDTSELFMPLVRQYVTNVHESKFFVNVKNADINLHGVAPFMPPPVFAKHASSGLSLQLWSDPTCNSSIEIILKVDIFGSMGKLWMRYRVVFAAFPIFVVALVLRQQFRMYDETGIFMSFAQGLNECVRTSIPSAIAALTLLSAYLASSRGATADLTLVDPSTNEVTGRLDTIDHELLLGSEDPFFWFLTPLFGLICVALCVAVNYVTLAVVYIFAMLSSLFPSSINYVDDGTQSLTRFSAGSSIPRTITIIVLLSLVSTVIPYHFAYVVLCLVQIATCIRGYPLAKDLNTDTYRSFYNYAHSILVLMLWILPINLPVLVVWVRNLLLHWLTPFSSHHNILAVLPFVLLVETMSTGCTVPRAPPRFSVVTNLFLFSIAAYAAIYGVTYAYVLHHLANLLCAWLLVIHFDVSQLSTKRIRSFLENTMTLENNVKKRP